MKIKSLLEKTKRQISKIYHKSHEIYTIYYEFSYLQKCKGVIHIGAHYGQEKKIYSRYDLKVLWIEADSHVYKTLQNHIVGFENQVALNYLVTEENSQAIDFFVASNDGLSSSIFKFAQHKNFYPSISTIHTVKMDGFTLPHILKIENIDVTLYDVLVIDTQGSELAILRGMQMMLTNFQYILVEACNFDSYENGAQFEEINSFLNIQNFTCIKKITKQKFTKEAEYFDCLYQAL